VSGTAWAGQAGGAHRCAVCEQLIRARDMEYQPHGLDPPAYAHVHCFTVWLMESRLASAARWGAPQRIERRYPEDAS